MPTSSYEDSVGGGVSQLSTTLYNATFFGCYKDVTHSVHALYISRYPMGREATLNYPGIDNQFQNDSSSGVLIRAFYSSGVDHGRALRQQGRPDVPRRGAERPRDDPARRPSTSTTRRCPSASRR